MSDLPAGDFDEHGRCPMLSDTGCSIYDHRPRTCRTYDCRLFAAAGMLPEEPEKALIAQQAARWQFTIDGASALQAAEAVRAAAAFLRHHRVELGNGAPHTTTQLAVAAVRAHDLFANAEPSVAEVQVRLRDRR